MFGFDIAVEDALRVSSGEHLQHISASNSASGSSSRAAGRLAPLAQGLPLQELHHQQQPAFRRLLRLEDVHRVRVSDAVGDQPFSQKFVRAPVTAAQRPCSTP